MKNHKFTYENLSKDLTVIKDVVIEKMLDTGQCLAKLPDGMTFELTLEKEDN